jgi:ABC-type Fe3+/spermidine/putrescine transport system ATPase subunit
MIAGLLPPSSGDITFDGRSVLQDRPEDRGAVMVFQNHLLFPHMSVAGNVGFGLRMRHLPKDRIADRVDEMLALVQLPGFGPRRPSDLSGGQQQRVALARALIVQPKVLLLDEPLSNLDAHLRAEMRDLIRGIQKTLGITTIFVTHDQEEAVVLADRVALILHGRLRQFDVPDAFYRRPADAEVAAFFGARNLVPGMSAGGVFDGPLGRLTLPADARSGAGLLTFRPESVRIGAAAVNTLTATVTDKLYMGTQTRLRLMVGEALVEAVLAPDLVEGISAGDTISINLPPGSLWVMGPTG